MLMMRLHRVGRRNDPSYRIVVTDKRTGPKSNKHVAILGSYNPKLKRTVLDSESALDWIGKGVQPSDTMHNILVSQGVLKAEKRNVLPRKSPPVIEAKTEEKTKTPEKTETEKVETDEKTEGVKTPEETAEETETPEEAEEKPETTEEPENDEETETTEKDSK